MRHPPTERGTQRTATWRQGHACRGRRSDCANRERSQPASFRCEAVERCLCLDDWARRGWSCLPSRAIGPTRSHGEWPCKLGWRACRGCHARRLRGAARRQAAAVRVTAIVVARVRMDLPQRLAQLRNRGHQAAASFAGQLRCEIDGAPFDSRGEDGLCCLQQPRNQDQKDNTHGSNFIVDPNRLAPSTGRGEYCQTASVHLPRARLGNLLNLKGVRINLGHANIATTTACPHSESNARYDDGCLGVKELKACWH